MIVGSMIQPQDIGGDPMGALAGAIYVALFPWFWAATAPVLAPPAAIVNRGRIDLAMFALALIQAVVVFGGSLLIWVGMIALTEVKYP